MAKSETNKSRYVQVLQIKRVVLKIKGDEEWKRNT
jgi:hypothetical protein